MALPTVIGVFSSNMSLISPTGLPRRVLPFFLAIITLALLFRLFPVWDGAFERLPFSLTEKNTTQLALDTEDYLEQLIRLKGLTHKVEWAAWHVQSTQALPHWEPVTTLQQKFQPRRPQVFDLDLPVGKQPESNGAFKTLKLPTPKGPKPGEFDASDYLFGVSTTYERLVANDRAVVKAWQWWLTTGNQTSNGAHIIVILDQASAEQVALAELLLKSLEITALVYKTDEALSSATRYLQMTRELRAFSSALTAVGLYKKWYCLIDDTIFLPSMAHLDERLSSYDPEEDVYIGMPSEKKDWQEHDGKLSTVGGGAVFLSRGAVNRFLSASCTDPEESLPPYHSQRWGNVLHACLTTKADMKMHVLPGLYSPDIDGNDTGLSLYESGGRPLVLHNRPKRLDTNKAYLVADECGEACFMQRFLFADGWVLVNSVSISQFQERVQPEDQERRETAMAEDLVYDEENSERICLSGGGERHVWKLLDSSLDETSVVWQAFVRKAPREEKFLQQSPEAKSDSIIILIWDGGK